MGLFKVDDMTCRHCEKVIKTALIQNDNTVKVSISLEQKTVKVENLTDDRVVFLLKEIGYNPEKIKH